MMNVLREIRYSFRRFRRTPVSSLALIGILALTLGVNGAIVGLARAVLFVPLPYGDPDGLVVLEQARKVDSQGPPVFSTSTAIKNWKDQLAGAFSDLAALKLWDGNPDARFDVVTASGAERLRGGFVTSNFFDVLRAGAAVGRTFTAADEAVGGSLVVISHRLWRRSFAGDVNVVGSSVVLSGSRTREPKPYTIVGVLSPDFRFTYPLETELWVLNPWSTILSDSGGSVEFNGAVARLAPGTTVGSASSRASSVSPNSKSLTASTTATRLKPIASWVVGSSVRTLAVTIVISLLLVLSACATVAISLLVRLASVQRDLAVRMALGAGKSRLVLQQLTDAALLVVAGGSVGLALAMWSTPLFSRLAPPLMPRADQATTDVWVVVVSVGAILGVLFLASLWPITAISRFSFASMLKTQGGVTSTTSSAALRRVLLGSQAALAIVLLVASSLLFLTLWQLGQVDLGFTTDRVIAAEIRLLGGPYREEAANRQLQEDLVRQLKGMPGVDGVGITSAIPFRGPDFATSVKSKSDGSTFDINKRTVDGGFFQLLGVQLLAGRPIRDTDVAGAETAAVVSKEFATRMFGSPSVIGETFELAGAGTLRIVGVANDLRFVSRGEAPKPAVYVARAQFPSPTFYLLARTASSSDTSTALIREAVSRVDRTLPVASVTDLPRLIHDSLAEQRFLAILAGAFATLAVLLTVAGVAVVAARVLAERRREFALRTALGATPLQLLWLVVRQTAVPMAAGISVGILIATSGRSILSQFLVSTSYHQTLALVIAVCAVVLGSMGAVVAASFREVRVDASESLRS